MTSCKLAKFVMNQDPKDGVSRTAFVVDRVPGIRFPIAAATMMIFRLNTVSRSRSSGLVEEGQKMSSDASCF